MSTHALLANMPKNHEILSVEEAQRLFFHAEALNDCSTRHAPDKLWLISNYDSFVPFNFFTHPDRNTPEQEKFQIIIRNFLTNIIIIYL